MKRVIEITIIAFLLSFPTAPIMIASATSSSSESGLALEQKKIYQTDIIGFGKGNILEFDGTVIHLANVGVLLKIPINAGNKCSRTSGTGNIKYVTTVNPFGKISNIRPEGVSYWEYDNQVGKYSTKDSNGMDYYSVDGAKYQSKTTSVQTTTTGSIGITRSSTSSFKAWYEGSTYDNTNQESNGFVLTAKIRMLKGSYEYASHTLSQPFRAPMTSSKSSYYSTSGVVNIFMPFGILPRIFKIIIELILSSVKIIFKFIQIEVVVHTWWDFPVLNSIFHLNLKLVTSKQVKYKEYVQTLFEKVGLAKPRYSLQVI